MMCLNKKMNWSLTLEVIMEEKYLNFETIVNVINIEIKI